MVAGCKQKMAEGLMTFVRNLNLLWSTKGPFWMFANMAASAVSLNITYYFGFGATAISNLK